MFLKRVEFNGKVRVKVLVLQIVEPMQKFLNSRHLDCALTLEARRENRDRILGHVLLVPCVLAGRGNLPFHDDLVIDPKAPSQCSASAGQVCPLWISVQQDLRVMHDPVCFLHTLDDLVQEVLAALIALSLLLDGLLKLSVLGGSGPLLDDGDWLEQMGPDRQHVWIEQQDVEHAVHQLQSQGSPVDSRLDVIQIVELWSQSHRQFVLPHLQRQQQLRFRELVDKDILKSGAENNSPAIHVRLGACRRDQLVHLFES